MRSLPKNFMIARALRAVNVASLFSGGKDSAYATYIAQQTAWTVKHLVTVVPVEGSMMFHHPNVGLAHLLAEAMGIPHVSVGSGEGEGEELTALGKALRRLKDVEGVVTGAIASDYQWSRINGVCHSLGLKCFSPLWRRDPGMLLWDLLAAGFEVVFVGASAEGFDRSWLGRRLDEGAIRDLIRLRKMHGVNLSGEGGEYETLALSGPNFAKRLVIERARVDWKRD